MTEANIGHVIIFSLIGGLLSLIGGVVLLRSNQKGIKKFTILAVPFAAGSLLAAVFFDLLKEAIEIADAGQVLTSALGGIVIFFTLERLTHWFHHHHEGDERVKSPLLIVIADTLHNALDGVVIASSFLISIPTGIVTTIAVASHEIPQEIGDFGVLLSKGVARKKVLLINILSSLATVVAAVAVFVLGDADSLPLGTLIGLSAGFLLYVAASDLIPTIHAKRAKKGTLDIPLVMLLIGVIVVWSAIEVSHRYIDEGHDHGADTHLDADEYHYHAE